tara:strand:- start:12963 stop:13160 length:198 start_codon:yes stop_codon:yes gene_type:complete
MKFCFVFILININKINSKIYHKLIGILLAIMIEIKDYTIPMYGGNEEGFVQVKTVIFSKRVAKSI